MIFHYKQKAFTLIELLIVVAIIAILAAIAVPNFLEAQTRSKISRGQADMRSIATALEAYHIDYNNYVPDPIFWAWYHTPAVTFPVPLWLLTTPISFMTSVPQNVFQDNVYVQQFGYDKLQYRYFADIMWKRLQESAHPEWPHTGTKWALCSSGPDLISNVGEYYMFGMEVLESIPADVVGHHGPGCLYDSTNGTTSSGDIVRVGP
jgi:prepilin-type N-terminal cleavage/methylation domain-containing protein